MNTKQNLSVVERIARQGLMLVGLLTAALALAGVALAQSSAGTMPANAKAAPTQTTAKKAVETPVTKSGGRGSHEGITVHGHWTIEVRNPDGKLVSHTEFENSLVTAANSGTLQSVGSQALVALLNGSAMVNAYTNVPPANGGSGWIILLQSLNPGDATPCNGQIGQILGCTISASVSPADTTNIFNSSCGSSGNLNCLPNSLTISGSTTANQPGVIDTADTIVGIAAVTLTNNSPPSPPTFVSGAVSEFEFTSATLPQEVYVTAGQQTITATVVLSFQ